MTYAQHRADVEIVVSELWRIARQVKDTDPTAYKLALDIIADITVHEAERV